MRSAWGTDRFGDHPLPEQVRMLGSILGDTISELEGSEMLDLVERVRTLSKAHREGDAAAGDRLLELIGSLSLREIDVVSRAFAWWFVLVNLVEEGERVRVIQRRRAEAWRDGRVVEESIEEAVALLRRKGVDVPKTLAGILVEPVLTAHPTEARRRVVAGRVEAIRELIRNGSEDHSAEALETELREQVAALWATSINRTQQPTVMDEVRSGLLIFESTLFDATARVHQRIGSLAGLTAGEVPVMFRFASWIGGDRDGNPNVTPEITRATLIEHARTAVRLHRRAIERLHGHLSVSERRAGRELASLIRRDEELLGEEEVRDVRRLEAEPVRQKLALTWRRLGRTLESLDSAFEDSLDWDRAAFRTSAELIADLEAVHESLLRAGLGRLAEGRFARVLLQARIFGFHLAPLDMRQHADRFNALLADRFRTYGIENEWLETAEDRRIEILLEQLRTRRPLVGVTTELRDDDRDLYDTLSTMAWAQRTLGEESSSTLILSMTQSASDLLGALLLARDAGVKSLDVAPLFETIEDLRNGAAVLSRLFALPEWREHLRARGDVQQIMIGYSDSNKDGGYLAANWYLYQAQRAMTAACEEAGIRPRFFHGRGGTIGRGGGPANRAILAQPPGTVRGGLRLTEQGEVISDRYSDPEIADRHIGQVLNAVIRMGVTENVAPREPWVDALERMAQIAEREYRSLIQQSPELIDYFHQTTPLDVLPELNIGSRPAKRKGAGGLESLRAIPWVFAWSQSRVTLPGWYGLGSALTEWRGETPSNSALLREMYSGWPFFQAVVDNAQMSMRKADLRIARLYAGLAEPEVRDAVWPRIQREFERTEAALLEITGNAQLLGEESWLSRSIDLRNPYIDPMNAIQVALLERLRSCPDQERSGILNALLVTLNGVAGGLRNTG